MSTPNTGVFPLGNQSDSRVLSGGAWSKAITPSDVLSPGASVPGVGVVETDWFDPPLRGFVVTGAGTVAFTLHGNDADDKVTSGNVITRTYVAGEVEGRFLIRRIWATGTTATGIIGLR